jgi:hypothetical protein
MLATLVCYAWSAMKTGSHTGEPARCWIYQGPRYPRPLRQASQPSVQGTPSMAKPDGAALAQPVNVKVISSGMSPLLAMVDVPVTVTFAPDWVKGSRRAQRWR